MTSKLLILFVLLFGTRFTLASVVKDFKVDHGIFVSEYEYICDNDKFTVTEAMERCINRGENRAIASIISKEVHDIVNKKLDASTYIDGRDLNRDGNWFWTEGRLKNQRFYSRSTGNVEIEYPPQPSKHAKIFKFSAWRRGQPDNYNNEEYYLEYSKSGWTQGFQWNDVPDYGKIGCYICEHSPCNPIIDCTIRGANASGYWPDCKCECGKGKKLSGDECTDLTPTKLQTLTLTGKITITKTVETGTFSTTFLQTISFNTISLSITTTQTLNTTLSASITESMNENNTITLSRTSSLDNGRKPQTKTKTKIPIIKKSVTQTMNDTTTTTNVPQCTDKDLERYRSILPLFAITINDNEMEKVPVVLSPVASTLPPLKNLKSPILKLVYRSLSINGNKNGFALGVPNFASFLVEKDKTSAILVLSPLSNYNIEEKEALDIMVPEKAIFGCGSDTKNVLLGTVIVNPKTTYSSSLAASSMVTTSSSTLSIFFCIVLGGAISAEPQAFSAFSIMDCSDPYTRRGFGLYRVLSPFAFWESFFGVVLGNTIFLFAVFIIHFVVFIVLKVMRPSTSWRNRMAKAYFPSFTLNCIFALQTGTAYAASQLASYSDVSSGQRIIGIIAFIFVIVYPFLLIVIAYKFIGRAFKSFETTNMPLWKRIISPTGLMYSSEVRAAFGDYVSIFQRRDHFWPSYALWTSVIVAIAGLFHPSTIKGCKSIYGAFAIIFLLYGIATIVLMPCRCVLTNILDGSARIILSLLLIFIALGLPKAVAIFGIVLFILTIVRVVQRILLIILGNRMSSISLVTVWVHSISGSYKDGFDAYDDDDQQQILNAEAFREGLESPYADDQQEMIEKKPDDTNEGNDATINDNNNSDDNNNNDDNIMAEDDNSLPEDDNSLPEDLNGTIDDANDEELEDEEEIEV